MTSSRPRWFWWSLGALFVATFALRLFWIFEVRPDCGPIPEDGPAGCHALSSGINDPRYVHEVANLLAEGHPYVEPFSFDAADPTPSAHKLPGLSTVLAGVSVVGGRSPDTHRVVGALIGSTTVLLVGLLAARLAGPRAGVIAAALAAAYPGLWVNDVLLQVELLLAPLIAIVLLGAYQYWSAPTRRGLIALSVAIAVASLTRSEAALLYVVMVIPLVWWAHRDWSARLRSLSVAALAAVLVVGPWIAFNLVRFNEPVLYSSTGPVLLAGSCDNAWSGPNLGLYGCDLSFERLAAAEGLPVDEAEAVYRDEFDESERAAAAEDQAVDYIGDNLGRLPVVVTARVARMWELYRPAANVRFAWQFEGRGERASWVTLIMYYAMVPAAVVGLVTLRRRRIPILPLVAMALIITLVAATTYGLSRYRVPAEVGLVAAAAVGGDALLRRRWPVSAPAPLEPPAEESSIESPARETPVQEAPVHEPPVQEGAP